MAAMGFVRERVRCRGRLGADGGAREEIGEAGKAGVWGVAGAGTAPLQTTKTRWGSDGADCEGAVPRGTWEAAGVV